MVTVKYLQDYGGYKKGQSYKVSDAKTLQILSKKGIIEIEKAKAEKAIAPTPEKAVITAAEVHTRSTPTKKAKK